MNTHDKIYVAGHNGLVGSAVLRLLKSRGFENIIYRSRKELDLTDSVQTEAFFKDEKPAYVVLAAARVGGIKANMTYPADFLYENLMIQNNVIHLSSKYGVRKLCFLGSSCIYPRECFQPMKEEYLMTGPFEPTNEGYAIAKLAGYKLCLFYKKQHGLDAVSLMPSNIYGPNDHFDLEKSHVLSAFVKRFVDAIESGTEEVTLWGTGSARREFLHADDMARAVLYFLETHNTSEFINIGPGTDVSIKELAGKVVRMTGYRGIIKWDTSRPDGMPRKCLDVSRMRQEGFEPEIGLDEGITQMIEIYRQQRI
ncbi:MAG: GDP-fucose synthetase [Lentisphaerae bacterium GWF2_45_14]|nr:MAG: GDP-fucose synthetase [Lentisphaerae bacterium GWF2_45_14]